MRSVLQLAVLPSLALLAAAAPLRSSSTESGNNVTASSSSSSQGFKLPVRQKGVSSRHGSDSKRSLARRQSGDTETPLYNLDDARCDRSQAGYA
jgi:hypothetical protein